MSDARINFTAETLELTLASGGPTQLGHIEKTIKSLGYTRLRVGVHHVHFRVEALVETSFGQELLRALDIIGVAFVILVVARHRRRQWLVGRDRAAIDNAHDAVLADGHVHCLAHLEVVEGRQCGFQGQVAGLQLITGDHQALELGIVLELQEFGRWHTVTRDVDFPLLQAQQRDHRILADLKGDRVEVRQARLEIVRVLLEQNPLPQLPLRQAIGAGAHRVLAKVGAP